MINNSKQNAGDQNFGHRHWIYSIDFRYVIVLVGAVINNSQIHQFGSGSNHSHNRQEPAAICKTDDAHYHDEKQNNVHDCTHGCRPYFQDEK